MDFLKKSIIINPITISHQRMIKKKIVYKGTRILKNESSKK